MNGDPTMRGRSEETLTARDAPLSQSRSIADRAYELWLQGGCASGTELSDWLKAERELDRATDSESCTGYFVEADREQPISAGSWEDQRGLSSPASQDRGSAWETVPSIIIIDQAGVIIDVTQAAAEMFRTLPESMLERPIADVVILPDERELFQRNLQTHVSREDDFCPGVRYEGFGVRADGSVFPIELMLGGNHRSGSPRFTIHVRDLTKQTLMAVRAAHFADLVQCSDDSIIGTTINGTVTSWNRGAERLYGYSAEDMIGRNISRVFPADRVGELALILKKIERGESLDLGDAVRRRKDGQLIDVSLTISPMRDRSGSVVGISAVGRDISYRKAFDRIRAAEHAVVQVLAESDSFDDARDRILKTIGEHLQWSFGAVWEADTELNVLECRSTWCEAKSPPLRFERHSQQVMLPQGVGLPGRVWESGEAKAISYPSLDSSFPRKETAASERLCSGIAFPVRTKRSFYCVFEFLSRECREPSAVLLEMMSHVGSQIAQFMERRKSDEALHGRQREMEVAREIQQRLLPKCPPQLKGFEIAAATHPAQETGGDLFDFISLPSGSLGIVVGDASGHGIGAALVIAETRAYLRAFAARESDPGRLLAQTNRCLTDDLDGEFVTLFVGTLDPATRSIHYANAGHWPGCLISAGGEVKTLLPSTGIPLGLDPTADFPTTKAVRFETGDVLLLFTDGIIEAASPEGTLFGMERVIGLTCQHVAETPADILRKLSEALSEFTDGQFNDDRTALVIKACAVS